MKIRRVLTTFLALQTQGDFLGNLGLLVEDGLGLNAEIQNNENGTPERTITV
jgi:hypothetical protein